MKKSSIYCLSILILLMLSNCSQREWYSKEILEDKKEYAHQLRMGGGYYYQGSVAEQFQLAEAMKLDSTDGSLWREMATARLKRGIADEAYYYYEEGVKRKPKKWTGFRGYCYLYFYRDYERAIADFDHADELAGEVDYSQGQNHDYMRGICYYGLGDFEKAFDHFDQYIEKVIKEEGEGWVDVYALLYRGLTHEKFGRIDAAIEDFDSVLKHYPNLSDAFYHKARMLVARENFSEALDLLRVAKEYHEEGYYHQRPYIEVLEQIYVQDIEDLMISISSI